MDICCGEQRIRISNLTVENSVRVCTSPLSDAPKNGRPFSMEDVISGEDSETAAIARLLESIAENPYDYDSHVAYIRLLRNLGARDELGSAREVFHSIFPFSEGSFLCVCWLTPLPQNCGCSGSMTKKAPPPTTRPYCRSTNCITVQLPTIFVCAP